MNIVLFPFPKFYWFKLQTKPLEDYFSELCLKSLSLRDDIHLPLDQISCNEESLRTTRYSINISGKLLSIFHLHNLCNYQTYLAKSVEVDGLLVPLLNLSEEFIQSNLDIPHQLYREETYKYILNILYSQTQYYMKNTHIVFFNIDNKTEPMFNLTSNHWWFDSIYYQTISETRNFARLRQSIENNVKGEIVSYREDVYPKLLKHYG